MTGDAWLSLAESISRCHLFPCGDLYSGGVSLQTWPTGRPALLLSPSYLRPLLMNSAPLSTSAQMWKSNSWLRLRATLKQKVVYSCYSDRAELSRAIAVHFSPLLVSKSYYLSIRIKLVA